MKKLRYKNIKREAIFQKCVAEDCRRTITKKVNNERLTPWTVTTWATTSSRPKRRRGRWLTRGTPWAAAAWASWRRSGGGRTPRPTRRVPWQLLARLTRGVGPVVRRGGQDRVRLLTAARSKKACRQWEQVPLRSRRWCEGRERRWGTEDRRSGGGSRLCDRRQAAAKPCVATWTCVAGSRRSLVPCPWGFEQTSSPGRERRQKWEKSMSDFILYRFCKLELVVRDLFNFGPAVVKSSSSV